MTISRPFRALPRALFLACAACWLIPLSAAEPAAKPADTKPAAAVKPAAAPAAKPAAAKPAAAKPATAKPAAAASKPNQSLVWRGDIASARGLMSELAKLYEREKKVRIQLTPFSTVSGIDAVTQGSADFAGSLRPNHPKRNEESGLTFVPVAWDGLVMITSPANPVSNISIKDIWRVYYGRADNWKLLGGNDKAINMYAVAGPLDGVEYALRWLIFRNGDQRVAVPRVYLNTSKLEEAVTLDPSGLGVSTLSNTAGNPKLKLLNVEGVVPSTASVRDGSYALYTPVYVVLREDGSNAAAVKDFIAWLETPNAKALLLKRQLLPYADGLALKDGDATRLAMIETKVNETPLAAPAATAAALTRVAPTSALTQEAKAEAAESRSKKASAKKAKAAAGAAAEAGGG
ncbi:substrate-binding domain-containing protein [Tahibacter caeni]|uniref:substrate-binding domain-containing protein n=1 Tax=Tahibacter caeni TaxID=1453545 RepID=UPI0021474287